MPCVWNRCSCVCGRYNTNEITFLQVVEQGAAFAPCCVENSCKRGRDCREFPRDNCSYCHCADRIALEKKNKKKAAKSKTTTDDGWVSVGAPTT